MQRHGSAFARMLPKRLNKNVCATHRVTAMKCAASTRCRRFVFGVRSIGSTDTTIGNNRIALTVTAMAACATVAPEPSVEIRMICAGPAQTSAVLASTQPRLKWVSCASAPMPR